MHSREAFVKKVFVPANSELLHLIAWIGPEER
jgi:hypothetical protein